MKAFEVKRGNVVEHDGKVYQIRDIERSSPQGRGGNVTFRFIMYSVPGAQKLDLSLRAEDELRETELTRRAVTFSYKDGDAAGYVADGIEGCYVQLIDDAPVALQLPPTVALEVVETAPELRGATATK